MFELKYVHVKNFRCHSDFVFVPLPPGDGITALSGPNGSGKSSVLYALIWALYGKTPDGVTNAGLRKDDSDGDVCAQVGFVHNGQHIDITRRMRGNRDSTTADVLVDGTVVAEASSRGATSWVEERLAMGVESFTTAFVVQQKEVDSLMNASAAERRRIIERLAGIDVLSHAVAQARVDAREHAKLVTATEPTMNLDDITAEHSRHQQILTDTDARLSVLTSEHQQVSQRLKELHQRNVELTGRLSAVSELQRRLELENETHESLTTLLAEMPEPMSARDLNRVEAELAEQQRLLQSIEESYHNQLLAHERAAVLREAVLSRQEEARTAEEALRRLESDLLSATLAVDAGASIENHIAEQDEIVARAREQLAVLNSRRAEALSAIDAWESRTDATVCPTCQQSIADPAAFLEHRHRDVADIDQRITAASETLAQEESTLAQLHHRHATLRESVAHRRLIQSRIEDAQATALAAGEAVVEAQVRLGDHEDQSRSHREISAADVDEVRSRVQELHIVHAAALRAEEARSRREAAQERLRASHHNIRRIHAALADLNPDELTQQAQLAQVEEKSVEDALASLTTEQTQLTERQQQVRSHVAALDEQLTHAREQLTRHQRAEQRAEELRLTQASLEEFRTDRIHRLAPDISDITSALLREATDGAIRDITFDESFTATVTTGDGAELLYGQLSGGEAETVSLSLRLAISYVLAGSDAGLLFVDEALTAQDSHRRRRAMTLLRRSGRQVVVINHAVEDQDMVDSLIELSGRPG